MLQCFIRYNVSTRHLMQEVNQYGIVEKLRVTSCQLNTIREQPNLQFHCRNFFCMIKGQLGENWAS